MEIIHCRIGVLKAAIVGFKSGAMGKNFTFAALIWQTYNQLL